MLPGKRDSISGTICTLGASQGSDASLLQVAFDPVDGSSVLPANFAVGSIFGIWPGGELLGRTGRQQAAACYAVYGPRTVLVLSRPRMGEKPSYRVLLSYLCNCLQHAYCHIVEPGLLGNSRCGPILYQHYTYPQVFPL